MKFVDFIKKHLKISATILVIIIATTVGVVYVKASSVTLSVNPTSINFDQIGDTTNISATVSLNLDSGSSALGYTWSVADPLVATISTGSGTCAVTAAGGGKTTVQVQYDVTDTFATKSIPVTVPLTVDTTSVSGILSAGALATITADAADSKNVVWSSSNSNIVSIVAESSSPNGEVATLTAVSGGAATITASIPEDSLSYSFVVTVGVSITEDSVSVEQNENTVLSTNSNSVSSVYWWSLDDNVASVVNGVVTGVYAGTTTIYASGLDGDITNNAGDSVSVTVPYNVTQPSTTVLVGDQVSFSTTANPSEVNYASSNSNVLTYDSATRTFKAVGTGTADISVTWNGNTNVTTIDVIDGFTLSSTVTSLNIGTTTTITASASNTTQPIYWTIADESIATIEESDDGLSVEITALSTGTLGYTTLVATQEIGGVVKSASCKVYVLNPVNSLTLLYNGTQIVDTISIQNGNSIYITAFLNMTSSVIPDNTKLSWISSDESVIALTPTTTSGQQQLCQVTALGGGNATITVVSEDGLYIATADFYVTEGVTNIELDETSVTAQMALSKYQLTSSITPDSEGVDTSVTWTSLDTSVVTVDSNGLVTFVGPGETYVSATSNADTSKIAYCRFHITQQVEDVTMDYEKVTLSVGEEYRLSAVITPEDATNQNVTWSSSNEEVVIVDSDGMLIATGSGSATIIIQTEDGGYIDMTNVTVVQPVTSISMSQTEISVKKGAIFWLDGEIVPSTADNKEVTWTSSDTSLATVDSTGKVTTLAVGSVTISCVSVDSGAVGYCLVEITEPVTGLTLNTYYQEMVSGTKFVVVPTVLPSEAENKAVTFTSSDTAVATVDENGIVSALQGGSCEIIVKTVEGSVEATCTIQVKEYVTSIDIEDNDRYLNVDSDKTLSVVVGTETATNQAVYWTSSDSSIGFVTQSGIVSGRKTGTIVITATAADGSGVSDSVVIRVINPVTSINLSDSKITIYVGDTYNVSATVNPSSASIQTLEWTSDDESIAKVYPDGDVVAVSAGRTVVHATSTDDNGVVANCTVIVKDPVSSTSLTLNSSEITMLKGKTRTLSARMFPTNTNETVKWVSTDTSIVTVDQNGNIITVGAGVCEVVAYSSLGSVEDSCTIYSLAMSCTKLYIEQYDTFNLYVDGAPSDVSWRSSDPRIATVTQAGLVTARMEGNCVITGTVDGKTVTCIVEVHEIDPNKFINP